MVVREFDVWLGLGTLNIHILHFDLKFINTVSCVCDQFHDKIDPMLESLERISERLRQPPSISVEVEKIREQISENKALRIDLEKLQPSYETLKQRGEEMIARSQGADKDLSAKGTYGRIKAFIYEEFF